MEIWNGALRDEREIEVQDSSIVVTHRISATSPKAVQFRLIDPFPGQFDIDEIGFHPDYEPANGWLLFDEAVISGVVTPDEPVVVKYGLRPESPPLTDEVEQRQATAKPSIELSMGVDDAGAAEADLETASMTRSSTSSEPAEPETSEFVEELDWRIREMEKRAESPSAIAEGADRGEDERLADTAPAEEPKSAVDPGTDEDGESSGADGLDRGDEFDQSRPNAGAGGDPFDDRVRDAATGSGGIGGEQAGSEHSEGETQAEADREPTTRPDASPVERLIDELESGDLTDDQRERLGDRLQDLLAEPDRSDRSAEVRLEHLESEMQRFSAYADALEAIIETHGPAEEFLSSVRGDIADLEASVEDLQTVVDRARSSRNSQRERLGTLADELGKVESRQSRLHDEVESLQGAHRKKSRQLETRIEEIEPAVGRIDELETELESVRTAVDDVQGKLAALRSALSDDLGE